MLARGGVAVHQAPGRQSDSEWQQGEGDGWTSGVTQRGKIISQSGSKSAPFASPVKNPNYKVEQYFDTHLIESARAKIHHTLTVQSNRWAPDWFWQEITMRLTTSSSGAGAVGIVCPEFSVPHSAYWREHYALKHRMIGIAHFDWICLGLFNWGGQFSSRLFTMACLLFLRRK